MGKWLSSIFKIGKKVHYNFNLHVLAYRENGKVYVHCLELDLIGEGNTKEEALKDLQETIESQVKFAAEKNWEEFIFHHAPFEFWRKYYKGNIKKIQSIITKHKIPIKKVQSFNRLEVVEIPA